MKAVLLAGGLGTRFSEETDVRPKPMIEIGGKPILWHIMKIYSQPRHQRLHRLPRLQGLCHQGIFLELFPAPVQRDVRPARKQDARPAQARRAVDGHPDRYRRETP